MRLYEACFNLWEVQHITEGDRESLARCEDDGPDSDLADCGLIPKAHSATTGGVVTEIRPVWSDVVGCTTVHHPPHTRSSVQGTTNLVVIKRFYKIIDLLNGGGGRYELVTIGGFIAAARAALLLLCFCLVLLPLTTVRLDVPLLLAVVAGEVGMIPRLSFAFDGGRPGGVE